MRILFLLLVPFILAAQESVNPDTRSTEAAHKSMKSPSFTPGGAMGEIRIPRGQGKEGIVHVKLPPDRGLKNPMFCWVDDFTDHTDVQVLKLTPWEIVIKAKRGHLIDWNVSHR
jgi:hypothetical protein